MNVESIPEAMAALKVLAPDWVNAIDNRDAWKRKADNGEHPGKGFCLTQRDNWNRTAREELDRVSRKLG